jgi:hypothetical protein
MEPMKREGFGQGNGEQALASLFLEYKATNPDPESSESFMPGLWNRIEARRNSSVWVRRWAQGCLAATLALTLLVTAFVLPRYQAEQAPAISQPSYLDILAAADTAADNAILTSFEQGRGQE